MNSEQSADVVVVGSGMAGLCAALTAAENGLRVIVLERMETIGGTTRLSDGILNSYDPKRQGAVQIEDSPEKHLADMLRTGRSRNHRNLAETLCYEAYPAVSWLESMSFAFAERVEQVSGAPYPRCHRPRAGKGDAYIDFLAKKLEKIGRTRILTGICATDILRDFQTGKVIGLAASAGSERLRFSAQHGVVLAHGGFQANRKMLSKFSPMLTGVEFEGAAGCCGELLSAAQDIDAQAVNTGYFVWETSLRIGRSVLLRPEQFILVNDLGRRFCREDLQFDALGERILQQPGHHAWCVSPHLTGMDPVPFSNKALSDSITEYNKSVTLGQDRLFGKSADFLKPLAGKLGVVKADVLVKTTLGGLLVNEKAQVLDRSGLPIRGLTAAGDAVGGIFGCWSSVGDNLAAAAVFGRLAGQTVSAS